MSSSANRLLTYIVFGSKATPGLENNLVTLDGRFHIDFVQRTVRLCFREGVICETKEPTLTSRLLDARLKDILSSETDNYFRLANVACTPVYGVWNSGSTHKVETRNCYVSAITKYSILHLNSIRLYSEGECTQFFIELNLKYTEAKPEASLIEEDTGQKYVFT